MTRINTNVSSLVAQSRLRTSNASLETSLTRLSTGLRINTGKDDPAGLIASESLRSDITSINKAISNTQRANQVISTADSALGQVSSLLNDIRGLVVEAANSGALSDDEIAANQLQVDSSLEAINRIAQTTTFQGRKLLDGSLDFLTSAGSNFTEITDLKINQANLGATGSVNLDVQITSAATRGRVNVTNIPAGGAAGTGEVTLTNTAANAEASTTIAAAGGAGFDITVLDGTSLDGTAGNDVTVDLANGTTAAADNATSGVQANTDGSDYQIGIRSTSAYAGAAGNDLTYEIAAGSTAISQASSAAQDVNGVTGALTVNALAGGDYDGTKGTGVTVTINGGGTTSSGIVITGNTTSVSITIEDNRSYSLREIKEALAADGLGDDVEIVIADGQEDTLFRSSGASDNLSFALDGGVAGEDADALVDVDADGNVAITVNDQVDTSLADIKAAVEANADFAANFTFNIGTGGDFASTGTGDDVASANFTGGTNEAAEVSFDAETNVLSVTVDDSSARTAADVRAALEADAAFAALFALSNDTGTFAINGSDDIAGQAFTGGTDTTVDDVLTITGPTGEANNGTVTINQATGVGTTPTAEVDEDGNITVTVDDTASTTLAAIGTAISGLSGYSASVTTSAGDGAFAPATDSITSAGITGATDGGITDDVVFELSGKNGSQVFQVSAGTDIDQLIAQVNLSSEATGITASKDSDTFILRSNAYGEKAIVDLRIIEEESSGTFTSAVGVRARDTGSDLVAKINGVDATGDGNKLSVKTSTLDLDLSVNEGFSGTVSFGITGGGAKFQLGPEVVSNQQARIGIGSVNTARLGGVSGKLFELGNGGTADLASDPTRASEIVDEAITQVASLRGRLGAFQSATLESSLVSLTDTVANLTEAESSIRDADFAAESAALTRSQILVQSGTSVLGIANQNPQNVLSLLR